MYIGLHEQYSSSQILMKLANFSTEFSKNTHNIKFHEQPLSGSPAVPYGRKEGRKDGQADRYNEANTRLS